MVFKPPAVPRADLPKGRTLLMGIVNVTPDSFSDGGKWFKTRAATERGLKLVSQGADIIDVGGESTRPGSHRIDAKEEIARIEQVVRELLAHGVVVSVDTLHAETAHAMSELGVHIINDVSGASFDPQMAEVMAASDSACVIQHWRGLPGSPEEAVLETDPIPTLVRELAQQVEMVVDKGVDPKRIILDPGLGFAKTVNASWQVLSQLDDLIAQTQLPLLIGHSRKRFIQAEASEIASVDDLTVAVTAYVAGRGVWATRVHEAKGNAAAIRVVNRLQRGNIE